MLYNLFHKVSSLPTYLDMVVTLVLRPEDPKTQEGLVFSAELIKASLETSRDYFLLSLIAMVLFGLYYLPEGISYLRKLKSTR